MQRSTQPALLTLTDTKSRREWLTGLVSRHWAVVVAFLLMAVYLRSTGPMNDWSGDAASIWDTIKSFSTGAIVPSYVLYKGFFSIFPYIWLYKLTLLLGTSEFVFVKLFHTLLFAYVAAIGFPFIIESLTGSRTKPWRKVLFSVVIFWLWESTRAFDQVMVDLPSMAYFVMLVCSAIKLTQPVSAGADSLTASTGGTPASAGQPQLTLLRAGRLIYTGLLVGISMSLSGQYSIAALCVLLYLVIRLVPFAELKQFRMPWSVVFSFGILLVGFIITKGGNMLFERVVIDALRRNGGWIPDGGTWLRVSFIGRIDEYRWGAGPTLIDYRGLSILKDLYGSDYEKNMALISEGKISITVLQYFRLVAHYPFDYLMKYFNRLFVALSPDGGYASVSRLAAAYTMVYVSLYGLRSRVRRVRDFFRAEALLVLSFVFAITAVIILCVEPRYVLQIQGFVFAYALLSDTLWDSLRAFGRTIRTCVIDQSLRSLHERPFPYAFLFYVLFLLLCFAHMGTLYETTGVNPAEILFRF